MITNDNTTAPHSHGELLRALKQVKEEVESEFYLIPVDQFFGKGEKWSHAERLLHLIKSVSAVAKGLGLPRSALSLMFGTAKSSGKGFNELHADYLATLAAGGKATGKFVPSVEANPENPDGEKEKMISKWKEVSQKLYSSLESWNEEDLNRYQMPHPLLGKLTVREMIFFTLFHNRHHLQNRQSAG